MKTLHHAQDGRDTTLCCGIPLADMAARGEAVAADYRDVTCAGEARAHHASETDPRQVRGPGWSAAAAASIAAADAAATGADLAAARRGADATTITGPTISGYLEPEGDRWAQMVRNIGARERRTVLSSQVVEDCAARVAAWANSLPTPEQRQTAMDAADVVRQGR